MQFKVSRVFEEMIDDPKPVFVLEGGARSTKTTSATQLIDTKIFDAYHQNKKLDILILREKRIWNVHTAMKDFFRVAGWYDLRITPNMNVTRQDQYYEMYGSNILFSGCDYSDKFLGTEYDIIWLNEAMQISYSVYRNLMDRCRMHMILDYNPNATEHWIYDKVIPSTQCKFIHSTMLDNAFLEENIRRSILSSEPTPENIAAGTADPTHWKIYGLGQRAQLEGLIYRDVRYVDEFPENCAWTCYSLDFGFTQSPTALTKEGFKDGEIWRDEILYETGLTNLPPIKGGVLDRSHNKNIDFKLREAGLTTRDEIYADSAEMKSIQELRQAGWNVIAVQKPGGSVNEGIGICQRYRHNITHRSQNIKKEYSNYKWMDSPGNPDWTEEDNRNKNRPVKAFDHSMDGMRYVALAKLKGVGQKSMKASL